MKYLLLITCLISSITANANEDFYGVYEQEPIFDSNTLKFLGPEKAKKLVAKFEESKITLNLTADAIHITFGNEEPYSLLYQIQGEFLLAEDDDRYWVLYLKEPNHIFSTIMRFNRVKDLNKPVQPIANASAE